MADKVQDVMEGMIPVLKDLQEREIFSETEIKSIISKRREFEYRVSRRDSLKQDYLDYIKYEIALETLRRHRYTALKITKAGPTDHYGPRHIHNIFRRAEIRFKHDKSIWFEHINFCLKSGGHKILQRIIASALEFHPREASLWLIAADRELQANHVTAARTLLIRGVRMAPQDWRLWAELLKFESTVAVKMARANDARGKILTQEEDKIEKNEKTGFESDNEEDEEEEETKKSLEAQKKRESEALEDPFAVAGAPKGPVSVRALVAITRHVKKVLPADKLSLVLAATYITATRMKLASPKDGLALFDDFLGELESGLIEVGMSDNANVIEPVVASILWRDLLVGAIEPSWGLFSGGFTGGAGSLSNSYSPSSDRISNRKQAVAKVVSDAVGNIDKMRLLTGIICSAVAPVESEDVQQIRADLDVDGGMLFTIDNTDQLQNELLVNSTQQDNNPKSNQEEEDTLISLPAGEDRKLAIDSLLFKSQSVEPHTFAREWENSLKSFRLSRLPSTSIGSIMDTLSLVLFRPRVGHYGQLFELNIDSEQVEDSTVSRSSHLDVVVGAKALEMQRRAIRAVYPPQVWCGELMQHLPHLKGEMFTLVARLVLHLATSSNIADLKQTVTSEVQTLVMNEICNITESHSAEYSNLVDRSRSLTFLFNLLTDLDTKDILMQERWSVLSSILQSCRLHSPSMASATYSASPSLVGETAKLIARLLFVHATLPGGQKKIRLSFASPSEKRLMTGSVNTDSDDSDSDDESVTVSKRARLGEVEVATAPVALIAYDVAALIVRPEAASTLSTAASVALSALSINLVCEPTNAKNLFKKFGAADWLPSLSPLSRRFATVSLLSAAVLDVSEHLRIAISTGPQIGQTASFSRHLLSLLTAVSVPAELLVSVVTNGETDTQNNKNYRLAKAQNGSVHALKSDAGLIRSVFGLYIDVAQMVEDTVLPAEVTKKPFVWGSQVALEERMKRCIKKLDDN